MAKKSKSIDEIMAEEGIVPAAIPKPTMDTTLPNAIKFFWPTVKLRSGQRASTRIGRGYTPSSRSGRR